MTDASKSSSAERFRFILERTLRLSRERVQERELAAGHRLLCEWQCQRLSLTYDDFARQSRYQAAVEFFLSDLYGPVDFSQRDEDIARVYPLMVKVLSGEAIDSLSQGLALNSLTMELDLKLLEVLEQQYGESFSRGDVPLDFAMYARAYKACDNYEERRQQISMIVDVGQNLELVTRKKFILAAVKLARKPAHLAGFGELQSFIERGLAAFRKMGKAEHFLDAVHSRESRLLDAIFADQPVPEDVRVA